jgi:predicted dienelactone hydrolase
VWLQVDDPRGGTLDVEVWYPAAPAADDEPDPYIDLPMTLGAFRNAPPERGVGPRPLLAFSHGFGGIRFQSAFLTEHLASHGYVVVAPDHPGSTLFDFDLDENSSGEHLLNRPDDVRIAVDEVLRLSASDDALLGGMIDGERYTMMGHSFGAVTTMALGGAPLDFDTLDEVCATSRPAGCSYLPEVDRSALVAIDERIDAMVLMAPGGWYAFGEDGADLAGTVPSLVLAGDRDTVLPYDPEARPTWERLGVPSDLGTLDDAGHYAAFSDLCLLLSDFADCAGAERGYMRSKVGQDIVRHTVTAWIGATWLGDERHAEQLEPDALDAFKALSWEVR